MPDTKVKRAVLHLPLPVKNSNIHHKVNKLSVHPNELFRSGLKFENDRKFKNGLILKAILSMTVLLVASTILFVSWSKLRELQNSSEQAHITTIIRKVPFNYDLDTTANPSDLTVLSDVRTEFVPPTSFASSAQGNVRVSRDVQMHELPSEESEDSVMDVSDDEEDKNVEEDLVWVRVPDKTKRNVVDPGRTATGKTGTKINRRQAVRDVFWTSKKDEESIRKSQAERMLSYMDTNADPCQDFYQYSCGRWGDVHPIPDDRGGYDTFEMLRENLESVLRDLLMEPVNNDTEAVAKAKTLFRSCMDEGILEERGNEPLLNLLSTLGGWPLLDQEWNATGFNWVQLASKLKLYNNDILIYQWVAPDFRDSSNYIIQFDQPNLGLPTRDFFLQEQNKLYLDAYETYMAKVAILLGAEPDRANKDANELIEFEKDLARITTEQEERRNVSEIYEKLTLEQLETQIPDIDWRYYLEAVLKHEVNSSQPIVLYARKYFKLLVPFLQGSNPRTVANYLIWRFVKNRVNNLEYKFQEVKQELFRVLSGREKMPARWSTCVMHVNGNMGMAVGSMFVKRYFDENSKKDTLMMTNTIMDSFKDMLDKITWIDEETRHLSREKVRAMILRIGYPDFILEPEQVSVLYKNVSFVDNEYFENTLQLLQHTNRIEQGRLGTTVNKTEWSTYPALVNAYYSRNKNQIMVPAGILQPPFYHRHFPRSLNYGGIGVVIGHEITHGFDDKCRLFDIEGNLHRWWKDEAIEGFRHRAKCLIEQYNKYIVQEIDMKIDGQNTQGENIADNGGIKQAFGAYEKWLSVNGEADETLPTINATNRQLFFINFAQVWCGAMRPETSRNKIQTSVHSPGKFRVIGTLSNSEDFTRVFNCPASTGMNPVHKCTVW